MSGRNSQKMRRLSYPTEAPPFAKKDSSIMPPRTDILICQGNYDYSAREMSENKTDPVLELLHQQDPKAANLHTRRIYHAFGTKTLHLPGYQLLSMRPNMSFSRIRNIQADEWREQAHATADAFIYALNIFNVEGYYASSDNGWTQARWERDRFEINRILQKPSLVEHPHKPLLLMVDEKSLTPTYHLGRLLNLLGLDNRTIRRPFRAVTYSHDESGARKLKQALEWIAKAAVHSTEDATTTTASETTTEEDEGSIATTTSADNAMMSMITTTTTGTEEYILDYEPTLEGGNPTLQRFEPVKNGTFCPFARAAKLWGGKVVEDSVGRGKKRNAEVETAATLNAGPLSEFVAQVNQGEPLDGFCLETLQARFCQPEELGEVVNLMLAKLAELDPSPVENAMKMGPIDHPHWRFRFAAEDFFITTFSAIYPKESSRHAFGAQYAFMLFQPLTSFGRHGLVEDTPASATNWKNPTSMRDKARVAFKENGCPYHIPEELPYPVAEHIVKPLKDDGSACIKWWENFKPKEDKSK